MLPLEWVYIPAGDIVYYVHHRIMEGDCQTEHGPVVYHLPAFYMTKYPITNGQYMQFIRSNAYTSKGGNNFLMQLKNDLTPCLEDCPVTFVSHEDAKAFAAFYHADLPTEQQWQRAAEGPEGFIWPWGNEYSRNYLHAEGKEPTAVNAYPQGESAFHVMDLCGNTWEWTRNIVDDGQHRFTLLRGGCYYRGEHFWHFTGGPHPIHSHEKFPLLSGNFNRASTISFRCVREEEQ